MTEDLTTLVCLFHHQDQAQAAIQSILGAGVPQSTISLIDDSGSTPGQYAGSSLEDLGVPERDQKHLLEGVKGGGVIVAVAASDDHVDTIERIFGDHKATKIDEAVVNNRDSYVAPLAATTAVAAAATTPIAETGQTAIPIVEEELAVGKRTVERGGVRVYRRIVEIPVDETVSLREEHVKVERHPVDRAVSQQDLAMQGDRTIELKETAEEAVVGKSARVVEEVLVGKEATQRTQHIQDTVRKTEVEVEEIVPDSASTATRRDI